MTGLLYEAIYLQFTTIRILLQQIYASIGTGTNQQLLEIYKQAIVVLKERCTDYLYNAQNLWEQSSKNLSNAIRGAGIMITYLIQCSRVIEIAGCLYFIEQEKTKKDEVSEFIADFISKEPGCYHTPSDHYAVSLVLPILALYSSGHKDVVYNMLRDYTAPH